MPRQFHDGRKDGLQPLESPDPEHVHSFSDLLRAMQKTAFAGRQIGEAFDVIQDMVSVANVPAVCPAANSLILNSDRSTSG